MEYPVQITLRGIPHSATLERFIGDEARKLDRVCDRIVSCHMIAEALHPPERQLFAVRLNLTLPGTEVAVNRDHEADIYMAVRSAFEAARRQLQDHMSRLAYAGHRLQSGGFTRGK